MFRLGCLFSKAPQEVINITPKVEASAKLLGVKGSAAERKKVADDLYAKFSTMVKDTFEAKEKAGAVPSVTKSEIEEFYKKLAPNVKIELMTTDSDNFCGFVGPVLSGVNSVKSYFMKLPFGFGDSIYKSDLSKVKTLTHEANHFFNFITEPKYMAHSEPKKLSFLKKMGESDFYDGVLYRDEVNKLPYLDPGTIAEHATENKIYRKRSIKSQIINLFDENYSSENKIDILQKWRHYLKTEVRAYKEQDALATELELADSVKKLNQDKDVAFKYYDELGNKKIVSTKNLSSADEKENAVRNAIEEKSRCHYSGTVDQQLFIPEKINAIEEVLADEIKAQRAEQKKLFCKPEIDFNSHPHCGKTPLQKIFSFFKKEN